MKVLPLAIASLLFAAFPMLAGAPVEQDGPLTPCVQTDTAANDNDPDASGWGVEIATAFSKQEALDPFANVKTSYSNLLGSYHPTLVEVCNLHMGTDLQYSARIGTDSREVADQLCAQLRAAGGA